MDKMTSAEMLVIHEEFVDRYFRGNRNVVGVGRIRRTPFSWAILVTAEDPSNVSWPWEFKGMKVLVEQGVPGTLL
jgi:hypothetical protein